METTNKNLSDQIKFFRNQLGWTQEELAEKVGVTFQAVSKWENGKTAPDIMLLPTLAKIFSCTIDEYAYTSKGTRRSALARRWNVACGCISGEDVVECHGWCFAYLYVGADRRR